MEEGTLAEMVDNPEVFPSAKMHHLLLALREVQFEARERVAPFKAIIEAQQANMTESLVDLDMRETTIKAEIERTLESEFELDGWKYKGEVGSAQIVRPKNRISYDNKGLETLRLSLPEVDRLIGHLRTEKPSKSYLKVKVKS